MEKTELFSSVDRFVDFFNTWAIFKCFNNIFQIIKFPLLSFFSSKSFVILIKMVASSFSSETRLPFSFNKSLSEFKPLLLKQRLIVFQNVQLSDRSLTFIFLKYFLVLRRKSTQKFLYFLDFSKFLLFLLWVDMFFSLDLCIIAFLMVLVMKGFFLKSTIFFAGA